MFIARIDAIEAKAVAAIERGQIERLRKRAGLAEHHIGRTTLGPGVAGEASADLHAARALEALGSRMPASHQTVKGPGPLPGSQMFPGVAMKKLAQPLASG